MGNKPFNIILESFAMETPRDGSSGAMGIEDEAIQIQLASLFAAIAEILPVSDPSHSDLVDIHNKNHAAADSKKQQQQHDSLKKYDTPRKIDTTSSQVIAKDLETLKEHSQEVGDLLDELMKFAERDDGQGKGDKKKRIPGDANKRKMDILTAVCSNTMIDRPFFKLSLFSDIIRVKGIPVEKLSQLMSAPKGDNKVWKMLPSLINTSIDILIKLCCSWMLYASLIDLKKMATKTATNEKEESGNCLLDSSDPCVCNTVTHINNIIMKRRNSSLTTLLPGETTLQMNINQKSVMVEHLSEVIIPCLSKIESVLSDM